jgi:hypothetical protein
MARQSRLEVLDDLDHQLVHGSPGRIGSVGVFPGTGQQPHLDRDGLRGVGDYSQIERRRNAVVGQRSDAGLLFP